MVCRAQPLRPPLRSQALLASEKAKTEKRTEDMKRARKEADAARAKKKEEDAAKVRHARYVRYIRCGASPSRRTRRPPRCGRLVGRATLALPHLWRTCYVYTTS